MRLLSRRRFEGFVLSFVLFRMHCYIPCLFPFSLIRSLNTFDRRFAKGASSERAIQKFLRMKFLFLFVRYTLRFADRVHTCSTKAKQKTSLSSIILNLRFEGIHSPSFPFFLVLLLKPWFFDRVTCIMALLIKTVRSTQEQSLYLP